MVLFSVSVDLIIRLKEKAYTFLIRIFVHFINCLGIRGLEFPLQMMRDVCIITLIISIKINFSNNIKTTC